MWVLFCFASVFEKEKGGGGRECSPQRRPNTVDLLEQESQEVSCLTWVSGIELRSFGRITLVLNY